MSYKETDQIIIKEEKEVICVCDVCGEKIPDDKYPKIEVWIEWVRYRYDGDQGERNDLCSFTCLEALAKENIMRTMR